MKKRMLIAFVMAFVIAGLAACGGYTVRAIKSKIFSDEDYQAAVECMTEYFNDWEGCTLKEVSYAGDDAVYAEAEIRGVKPDCLIVLLSTFETDGENHENGLNPNYTYEDYQWILERTDFTMPWEHKDHGYG